MDKKQIREYAKEQAPLERAALATEVKELRKAYFDRRRPLPDQILQLEELMEKHKLELDTLISEIGSAKTALRVLKSNKIDQLLGLFEKWRLEKEIEVKSESLSEFTERYAALESAINALREQAAAADELEQVRSKVSLFYTEQSKKLEVYETDRKNRDVAHIIQEHDALVIHAIHPTFVPSNNSLVYRDIDWKTKLDIVLAFSPTVSASTIRTGETYRNMWARMGVVLKSGSVLEARSGDAGTVATRLKHRSAIGVGSDQAGDIQLDVARAITTRRDGYNELVVENPSVAGFYVCLDDTGSVIRNDLASFSDIAAHVKKLGLPLYVLENGRLYEGTYDSEAQVMRRIGVEMQKSEVLESGFNGAADEQRDRATRSVYERAPFKIRTPEVYRVESCYRGESAYIELRFLESVQSPEVMGFMPEPQEVVGIGRKEMYKIEDGKLYRSLLWRDSDSVRDRERYGKDFSEIVPRYARSKYIQLGSGSTDDMGRELGSRADYLEAMIQKIGEIRQRREAAEDESTAQFYDDWLAQLAFHVQGFGQQAARHGDIDSLVRAKEIANAALPEREYEDVVRRRMPPGGGFNWTIEDIS